MNRQGQTKIPELDNWETPRSISVELGLLQPKEEAPVSTVILNASDEAGFASVVNLLASGHNGTQTFSGAAPTTYFGDTNLHVSIIIDKEKDAADVLLIEVVCKSKPDWLTYNFIFCSQIEALEFSIFRQLVNKMNFYYIVPGLRGEADFGHIVLPKYAYKTIHRRA